VTRTRNERLIGAGLVLAALLTLLVAVQAYRTTAALFTTADLVAHTRQVQTALAQLVAAIQEVESGQRGYVVTGDDAFLKPRSAALHTLDTQLGELGNLIADNPAQVQRVTVLRDLIGRKVAFSQQVVETRAKEGFDAAAAQMASREGREFMRNIRALTDGMEDEEHHLLEVRSAALRTSRLYASATYAGFTVLGFGLLSLVYVVVRRDVAERGRAESNLRGLLDAAPDATLVVDASGRIVMVNAQAPLLFGYRREELLGQTVELLMPGRFRTAHRQHRADYARDLRTRPMGAGLQLFAVTKDGREFPVEISLSPMRTDSGAWITAAVRDTTERVRAAEALRQAAEQIRDLYDHAPCGYHSLGLDGTFIEINDTELSWLGRTRAEVVNRMKFTDVLTPDSVARFEREYPRFIRRGRVRDLEFEYVRPDGGVLPVLLNATAITDASGRYVSSRATTVDLSERQRAEGLLIERQTLERTNAELQEFSYVASHDLQEPLRKIQAFGDRLRSKHAATLPAEADDFLQRMQNAAARMQILINDLLSFSRVTTRAQPFVPVDLAAIAREVVSDLEGRIEQTHGRIELGDLPTIEADPTQMRQLLQNLLGNALKFHRPGVEPLVQVSGHVLNGSRGSASQPAALELSVTDNGIGFEERYLDRIFTIFQRLHGRNEYEGTGLGLAICRKIVERHHGHITAHSQPGQGTTFVVTLPVQQGRGDEIADDQHAAPIEEPGPA
jgi:two-component system, LuxR family, sensor kinase FixL